MLQNEDAAAGKGLAVSYFYSYNTGYSANVYNANIIVENIMMNDGRSGTEYGCMLFNNMGTRLDESYPIILYVISEYQYNMYTVIFNSLSRVYICGIYCYTVEWIVPQNTGYLHTVVYKETIQREQREIQCYNKSTKNKYGLDY